MCLSVTVLGCQWVFVLVIIIRVSRSAIKKKNILSYLHPSHLYILRSSIFVNKLFSYDFVCLSSQSRFLIIIFSFTLPFHNLTFSTFSNLSSIQTDSFPFILSINRLSLSFPRQLVVFLVPASSIKPCVVSSPQSLVSWVEFAFLGRDGSARIRLACLSCRAISGVPSGLCRLVWADS